MKLVSLIFLLCLFILASSQTCTYDRLNLTCTNGSSNGVCCSCSSTYPCYASKDKCCGYCGACSSGWGCCSKGPYDINALCLRNDAYFCCQAETSNAYVCATGYTCCGNN